MRDSCLHRWLRRNNCRLPRQLRIIVSTHKKCPPGEQPKAAEKNADDCTVHLHQSYILAKDMCAISIMNWYKHRLRLVRLYRINISHGMSMSAPSHQRENGQRRCGHAVADLHSLSMGRPHALSDEVASSVSTHNKCPPRCQPKAAEKNADDCINISSYLAKSHGTLQ